MVVCIQALCALVVMLDHQAPGCKTGASSERVREHTSKFMKQTDAHFCQQCEPTQFPQIAEMITLVQLWCPHEAGCIPVQSGFITVIFFM